ncbi:hypothetical protein TYRP_004756 [Tyrophagus putrescentiae]|nr:hypothetical protein TYRP_004756 [Tyrophagus putrescentiae]
MAKIFEVIQPCSERAVSNWNLNHSLFVPSRLSTCCANWEVYDCFIIASLESCSLLEFQALVFNITADALSLQKSNCSRYKYHSETCAMFNGAESLTPKVQ